MNYGAVIVSSWAAFVVVWGILALNVKKDVPGCGFVNWWSRYWPLRLVIAAIVVFALLRILTQRTRHAFRDSVLSHGFFAPPALLGWTAAALAVIGIAFAMWARFYLGRNWSAAPAMKENHELVTTGPYTYVRHPIYTGLLLASFGTALMGTVAGISLFILFCVIFLSRIGKEEKIMLELFPDAYPRYRKRTKKLIPFVW